MSFLAAAALPAVGGLVGGLLGGAGGKAAQVNYTPPGFSAGGLNATFGNNGYSVSPTADRSAAVSGLQSSFNQQGNAFGNLLQQWQPGSSNMLQSQLQTLNNQRTSALGNLRQNLAQRRVLGSSFAQQSVANADMQYQQNAAAVTAQSYLQELQASQQLTQQQFQSYQQSFQTGLNEMNLEAGVASDLTGKASSTLASAASTQAQLDQMQSMNKSSFFGGIGSMIGSAFGGSSIGGGMGSGGMGLSLTGTGGLY